MPVTLRAPVRGPQAGVVVHLPTAAERKRASERRISRSSRKQQGSSTAQLVPDRRLTVTIKQEKNAFLKANQEKLKGKRAAMAAAQRKMRDEQRKLQQDAKRELQKLMDGLHGVAKMKKELQLYLEAREQKRIDALPRHEKEAYLLEKKELQKIKRTSRVLYNQFLRRQPARVSRPLFPEWVTYISYLICFGRSIWSAFFVMMFGFTIGHVESQLWISSLVTDMAMTYVVSDPLKIFFRMGLMPIIAAGILADSGLFNALGSETLALGAMAAVGTSGVAQYAAKRTEKKRLKHAKGNRLVPTDQGVFVQALEVAAKEANEDSSTAAADAAAQNEDESSSTMLESSHRQGSFTDISRVGVRDAVFAQRRDIQAELEADERHEREELEKQTRKQEERAQQQLPKLVVTKGPPLQLIHPEIASASGSIARSPMKTVEQQSSSVLKGMPVSALFGPSAAARKPPVGPVSPARSSAVMPSTSGASLNSSVQARVDSPTATSVSHLCRCVETVREQDWTIHQQDVCSHRTVQCRAGCAMFLEARSRNGHKLSQCQLTMCNCGKMVLTKSLELHQQHECRNKTVLCRLNCGASMPSHQRERHERHECARRIATCVNCGCVRHAADMSAHLAIECALHQAKVAVSHAIVAAYSPSPVSSPPKLNVAAIRGPPITLIRSADTKPPGSPSASATSATVGSTMDLELPLGSAALSVPGLVGSDDASSPEKQKPAMMHAKVLARKAASFTPSEAEMKGPSVCNISSIRPGDDAHPLRSASTTSGAVEAALPATSDSSSSGSSGQKMSPIRKKMMARLPGPPPPQVPDDGASILSPREDEVLAAAATTETSTRLHGVDDQIEELDREFFGSAAKE
ncbi:hypothetical protein FI667_g14581, partial [Globisporangium splendens]